jgi:hypothetical protein
MRKERSVVYQGDAATGVSGSLSRGVSCGGYVVRHRYEGSQRGRPRTLRSVSEAEPFITAALEVSLELAFLCGAARVCPIASASGRVHW